MTSDTTGGDAAMILDAAEFWRGDTVRLRLMRETTGIVLDERGWGAEYLVKLSCGCSDWLADVELELVSRYGGNDDDPDGGAEAEAGAPSNVIHVDFTKRRCLAEAEPKGAA
jgi:hypothetical protein